MIMNENFENNNVQAFAQIPPAGQPTATARVCASCGAPLAEGQVFCGKCGQSIYAAPASAAGQAAPGYPAGQALAPGYSAVQTVTPVKAKSKAPLIIGCAAGAAAVIVGVILAIVLLGGSRFDFNKEFSDIRYEDWCTIAEDGTWMRLDTNPTDMDSDDMGYAYYSETFNPCNDKIEQVNTELGFSSAVFKKMGETTWSQGRQTESTEKFTVSWTYHPDKGLEVLYEVKK